MRSSRPSTAEAWSLRRKAKGANQGAVRLDMIRALVEGCERERSGSSGR